MSDAAADRVAITPVSLLQCIAGVLQGRWVWLAMSSLYINAGMMVTPLFAMLVYDKVVHNGVFETLWALVLGVVLFTAAEMAVAKDLNSKIVVMLWDNRGYEQIRESFDDVTATPMTSSNDSRICS